MLRIAIFTYSTQPRGGVLHALSLAEALHDAGHDVVLFALSEHKRGFVRPPRCPFVLFDTAEPAGDVRTFVQGAIATYVECWDPATPPFDVYHAHDGISGNALATLAERGHIPGFVRTVHHCDAFADPVVAALHDRAIVRASRLYVVSPMWRRRLAERYGRAASIVPNGVDPVRFAPANGTRRAQLRAEFGSGTGPLFVTIGGIEARKNTIAALEAFALVRAVQPAARFIIAGGASVFSHSAYRRAFDARRAELGAVAAGVKIAGVLPDERITALLQAADALVFPSLVEGFGLVVLEALACGTPVVASAMPPFTEYLRDEHALLVDPRDPRAIAAAMLRAGEPAVAARLATRGRAAALRFGWDAAARAQLSAYAAPRIVEREAVGA